MLRGRWPRRARPHLLALTFIAAALSCDGPNDPDPPTGSLSLAVAGLPDTIPADITLSGPHGFSSRVTGTRSFAALVPGMYTLSVAQVRTSVATFQPAFESLSIVVGAGGSSQATVIYAVTTGSIRVVVSGVPPDVAWTVRVSGPGGYRDSVSAGATLGNLLPGIYTVSTAEVRKGPSVYVPKSVDLTVTVSASITPSSAAITFLLITGSLNLHVNGLPAGANAAIVVTGPGGFSQPAQSSTLLEGLAQGRYLITADTVASGPVTLEPSPGQQSVTIVAGATGVASVNYWSGGSTNLNLAVESMHLQQVVQTYGGAVPAIAGRAALLRVFVRASQPNVATPSVRVRLYDGPLVVSTTTLTAPGAGVPTSIDEGQLTSSWNHVIPASFMTTGLRVLVDVDPSNAIAESVESDNSYPSSGTPLAMDVRTVAPLAVRLVPVTQSATGLTGNITTDNVAVFEDAARRVLPVAQMTLEVRPAYTSQAAALQPNDGNGAWIQVLSEINALRVAEGSSAHYYGVVRVPYTAGVIGISFLPSFAAVGWDAATNAHWTFVHEMGHHFGRLHSPACGAGGFDAGYPYPGGTIGVYGYDMVSQALYGPSTTDIMSYCPDRWISDYTYTGILAFRSSQANALATLGASAARPGLLVWGRIGSAGLVLEPSYEVSAPARLPSFGGPHRVDVLDSAGNILTTLSFTGEKTVDTPRDEEHFAFVIPRELLNGATPARIRLRSAGRSAEHRTQRPDFAATLERLTPTRVRVHWPDAPGRGVLVRDESGAILSFGKGGSAVVATRGRRLDLTLSDGVRSVRRILEAR